MNVARMTPWVAATMMVLMIAPAASALVIYQDDFSDVAGTIIDGKALDVAVGQRGGTAGAVWDATAAPVVGGNPNDIWETSGSNTAVIGTSGADANLIENNLLPLTPIVGQIYTLHIELNPSASGLSGNWLGGAFHQADYNNHSPGGASSALSNNDPYGLIIAKGSGQVQSFAGLGTANGVINTAAGTYPGDQFTAYDIVLDTRAAQWTVSWLINGSQVGSTFTYGTNPTIGLLSWGTNKLAGSARNFSLTAIPEPGSFVLLGLGMVVCALSARFRKRA